VNTDSSGNAVTNLTTSIEAIVTATVGISGSGSGSGGTGGGGGSGGTGSGSTSGQTTATVTVKVNPLPIVSITAQGTTFTAGTPVVFTISAQPAQNSVAQIRQVVVDFDDGTRRNLGAVSGTNLIVQHQYDDDDTYTVTVEVTDTLGSEVTAATVIVVQPQPPLNVTISKSSTPSGGNTIYTLTATVTPASTVVANYQWVQDGSVTLQNGPSNQLIVQYPTGAVHTITVTATTNAGQTASSSVVVP
jgi:hypothetical protein